MTSPSLWRHQESKQYRQHAKSILQDTDSTSSDICEEKDPIPDFKLLEVKCGPLLNYRRIQNGSWFGSVLIVTDSSSNDQSSIILNLKLKIERASTDGTELQDELHTDLTHGIDSRITDKEKNFSSMRLYSDKRNTFWRFDLEVPMQSYELKCLYSFPNLNFYERENHEILSFFVPAITESMRIMFYSCNGFSVGTNEAAFNGPCLWKDVLRVHKKKPFHVMIGGGDQIYNDGIRVDGPLHKWANEMSPAEREKFPFSKRLRKECDKYYVNNYIRWYNYETFAPCNRRIPQINIWDDHDIIDGYGSYSSQFMNCDVFKGVGGVANKYYKLFQHHLPPPASSFTSGPSESSIIDSTYVLDEPNIDPSYILGCKHGPYLKELSHNIYTKLGARISFLGIDGRTERTLHQINYKETYKAIIDRVRRELEAARSSSSVQHLIVLLGIPIVYPRLNWLENLIKSPLVVPIKILNKRFGIGGSLFNQFDGKIDLIDDLDDHYTSPYHKEERRILVEKLQKISKEYSVRVTFLGGDVHLAAVGKFYSNSQADIPIPQDHRFMANIISSAIVNKPPPPIAAYIIAKTNKIHHLNQHTDETMIKFFDRDPKSNRISLRFNHVTMPRRNWAMITENSLAVDESPNQKGSKRNGQGVITSKIDRPLRNIKDKSSYTYNGGTRMGSGHRAAIAELHGKNRDGSLDFCIHVEIDKRNAEGVTKSYGMTIPRLIINESQNF